MLHISKLKNAKDLKFEKYENFIKLEDYDSKNFKCFKIP